MNDDIRLPRSLRRLSAQFEADFQRFMSRINRIDNGCWLWTGGTRTYRIYGREWTYGIFPVLNTCPHAHRVSYQFFVGLLQKGSHVHHTCENTLCVNPNHLQQLSPSEHNALGNCPPAKRKKATHCIHGHEFTPENTYVYHGHRACKTCIFERQKQRRARLK